MKIRKRAGEQRLYDQPAPIGLTILPTKKLVTCKTRDYFSHEETSVSEAQEQHEGSPKDRSMKTALQYTYASTYVRRARAPMRTISLRNSNSSVTPLSGSRTPPCPIPRQLSSACLLVRMENDGSSRKRAGEQPSYVQPSLIELPTETRDYSSHEETPVSETQEQYEGSPKNLRRRKTALQDISVRNVRVPKRTRTHSLKVKRCVYNFSDNPSVLSSCDEGTHSHPLPAAAAAIWMDSPTSATPEPHQQHTRPDFYNLHLLADTAAKVSEAESGKVPMETLVSLELGNALQETKSQLYEGNPAMDTHESASKQERAMSKAEEQHQDAHKRMESFSPDTTVLNHPLFVSTRTDGPTVQRCLDNRSVLSRTCEGAHSHPLPAAAAAIWMDSTTSATPEPHQQHTLPDFYELNQILAPGHNAAKVKAESGNALPDFYKLIQILAPGHNAAKVKAESGKALPDFYKLNQILAAGHNAAKVKAGSAKVPMETPQVSLEVGNTLQETISQSYDARDSAMETHESGTSKEETAINEAEEQPQDANKTMESFSPNTTVCSLPLCLPPRTDGPKGQTCPELNLPLSRTAYEATYSHLPAAAPFPSTAALDLTLHRNPGGGHTQLDAANSVNGMVDVASQSAGLQMHASEPMSEATQYPCSAVQRPPTASVSPTSVPICLLNPLQGLSLDEKPKARRGRRRRQQDARRESPQHPALLRTAYEATRNQPPPAGAPFPSTVTKDLAPGVGHMQLDVANSGNGMVSFASQSGGLQMHASDPMLEATQYPCSAAQRPPAASVSPTSFPTCLSNPLQGLSLDEKPKARRERRRCQLDPRRKSPQHPPLLRTAYEATRNQPLPAGAPFPSTATQGLTPGIGHMQRNAANSGYGMFSVASQSAGLQMHASDPMLEATQYRCSAAQRPPAASISPTSFPICDPLQIQQAVAVLLTSGVFVNNLASIMLPQLSEQVTRSPANPLGDGLDESSVTTEGATADARRE